MDSRTVQDGMNQSDSTEVRRKTNSSVFVHAYAFICKICSKNISQVVLCSGSSIFILKNNIAGCYMQWFFYIFSKNEYCRLRFALKKTILQAVICNGSSIYAVKANIFFARMDIYLYL